VLWEMLLVSAACVRVLGGVRLSDGPTIAGHTESAAYRYLQLQHALFRTAPERAHCDFLYHVATVEMEPTSDQKVDEREAPSKKSSETVTRMGQKQTWPRWAW
jgi:hypothetical protein